MPKPKQTKAGKGSAASAPPADPRRRIIDAALELIAGRGWRNVALADIAAASGVSLAGLHALFESKQAILAGFMRDTDAAMLAGPPAEGSPRDRLFDVVLRRLDALRPHKPAIRAILRGVPGDPMAALCLSAEAMRSMGWMLEAAGIGASGIAGLARRKGLGVVYAATLRVWLDDETEDQARTMAALDRDLKRAEMLLASIPGLRRAEERGAS